MAFAQQPRTVTPRLRPGSTGAHRERSTAGPRGGVTEIQRSRMLAAALEAVEEVGYGRMTVAQVISRAKVSRKTFYDVFADREDCFLAAVEQAVSQVGRTAREAYEREGVWREGIRAGLAELLVFLDADPALARLCLVEALGAGPRVLERRAEMLEELAELVDQGRFVTSAVREPPEVAAEGVVGAVFAVLHTRVLEGGGEPFTNLLGSLMNIVVLPYLGARAASRELTRPAPEPRQNGGRPPGGEIRDPLAGLNMRLTYRTVRVLVVIAEWPGASNREVADRSGVTDQGQISKLLARLARLELVENTGEGQEKGGSNAWRLTPSGARVERATRPR
ncbi:MAG TPA: TetR/AcrR family transcriptional regulator [Solirubrobacteraceae bacterium]|nr:TetR/AcrR family transcriptional regulator [Solirubrobacteraceae bacterium]